MPDTHFYTPAELEDLAKKAGVQQLGPVALEKLQEEVDGYLWARESDKGVFFVSNKQRRQRLIGIRELLTQGKSDEVIQAELDQLDGPTSQDLGPVGIYNRQRLARAVRRIIEKIPASGPKRARRQFIGDLAPIYCLVMRVTYPEYGPFRDFVRVALKPFKSAMQGCEADIKIVLRRLKKSQSRRKTDAVLTS